MGLTLASVLNQAGLACSTTVAPRERGSLSPLPTVHGAPRIAVTERAAKQARVVIQKQGLDPAATWLRVGVKGGGCSGMSYQIDFTQQKDALDVEMEAFGTRVLVDKKSLLFLAGTELDWVTGLKGHGWQFNNPNTKKSCSCGESFTI
jgi:iron-sulfur cluster assembly protein